MDDTLSRTMPAEESPALEENRSDRERSLHALHELELRAGSPAPGREAQWLGQVLHSLGALEELLAVQYENSADGESMLSEIQRAQPRLHNRVVQLRRDSRDLHEAVRRLHRELEAAPLDDIHFADVRQRLDRLATELRYQRSREADLVYEAFNVDPGVGD